MVVVAIRRARLCSTYAYISMVLHACTYTGMNMNYGGMHVFGVTEREFICGKKGMGIFLQPVIFFKFSYSLKNKLDCI